MSEWWSLSPGYSSPMPQSGGQRSGGRPGGRGTPSPSSSPGRVRRAFRGVDPTVDHLGRLDGLMNAKQGQVQCRAESPPEFSGRYRIPSRPDTPSSSSSTTNEEQQPCPIPVCPQEVCPFCNRKATNVVCRACGHAFEGRVRLRCSLHPEVIQLMDHDRCPECRISMLKEFMSATLAKKYTSP